MTSGYMNCPKCGEDFQCSRWEYQKKGIFLKQVWVEYPEPWKCPKCKSLIITDKEKGHGLIVLKKSGEEQKK